MNFLLKIPHDKLLHFIVGVLVFAFSVVLTTPLIAFLVVCIVGVLKEVYDYCNKENHSPDIWDAIATILGGVITLFCTLF